MHKFIIDLCKSSSPEKGLRFSKRYFPFINCIEAFNYNNIYFHERLDCFKNYVELIINSIFFKLSSFYEGYLKKY
jgi:dGTPase